MNRCIPYKIGFVSVALVTVCLGVLRADDPPALTLVLRDAPPPAALHEKIQALLPKSSYRIRDASGNPAVEVWLRKTIPVQVTEEQVQNGLTYREWNDGTLIGAVQFHQPFVDYRKQEIPAGVYTLRFTVQPDVGDHDDTAPHPEFLVLSRAEDDTTDEPVEAKTLYPQSAKVTGGDHPGVMLLFPLRGKPASAKLQSHDGGVITLNAFCDLSSDHGKHPLGLALTVQGVSKLR